MTKIEWVRNADGSPGESWNPVVGCSVLTPGCTNCYAMKMGWRLANNPATPHYAGTVEKVKGKPVWTGKVARAPEAVLTEPLRRRKPTTYFVNSMGDLFHEDVPDAWIDRVFAVMALAPQHTFQVLTKRAERMREYVGNARLRILGDGVDRALRDAGINWNGFSGDRYSQAIAAATHWPLPNVWMGVSAERQAEADERIPDLLATPAAVRFVSVEPMLGPVDLTEWLHDSDCDIATEGFCICTCRDLREPRLDWVIAGGESGPGARPMHPDWARAIRDQCQAAGVPFFFKQWGEWAPGECADGSPTRTEETATWWDDRWAFGRITPRESEELHRDDEPDLYRFGKARAFRTLDGETWDQMPGPNR